jgi:predicted PurR-regulated permease PerM
MVSQAQRASFTAIASGYALGFIVVCLVTYILHVAAAILIPFVIAVFVWYLINAIARGLGKIKLAGLSLPRFLCFLAAMAFLVVGLWFTYKLIAVNVGEVIRAAPVYQKKLQDFLPIFIAAFPFPPEYQPSVSDLTAFFDFGGFVGELAKTFSGVAGKAMVVLFYTGFLLYEQQFFGRKLREMARDKDTEARIHRTIRNIDIKIQRYIWVKTLISALTGLSTWLLMQAFNINFAEFWGVMAFVLHFIPYVGSISAVVLPSIVALVQMGDVSSLVTLALGLTAIQVFFTSFLDPRMMGDSLNLSPIFIISSIAAWGVLWGVPGMFLAVPILATAVIIMSQFKKSRPIAILMSKTGEMEPDESARHA